MYFVVAGKCCLIYWF